MAVFHARWSSLKTFRTCQMKYKYSWLENLQSRRPPAPLIRGSMIGQCLDASASKKSIKPILAGYQEEYGKLFKAEQEEYGDIIGEVERIVTNYKKLYKGDGLTYLKGKDGNPYEIQVETEFTIDGVKVHFTGHIDKLVRDPEERTLVLDHKSHKAIPDVNARYNDLQLLTYVWLLPLSGLPKADGVLWDYLRTKPPTVPEVLKNGSLTKRANLDSDLQTYLQAIQDNKLDPADYQEVLDRFKAEGGNRYFERVIVPAPPKALIDNMVSDFKTTIVQIHDVTKSGNFVRNMSRDCNRCEFYNLCQTELRGIDSSFIRKQDYKERKIV
jgi:hypothetical protein